MKELMMNDSYQVQARYPLDTICLKTMHLLYQPLVGKEATSLYFSLWAELDQLSLTMSPCLHGRLAKITTLSLRQMQEAIKKLEAIGLLKTYCKQEEGIHYIYELLLPLTPAKFFHHQILSTLLYKIVGKEDYQRTKVCFVKNRIDTRAYQETTAKFSEVFDISLLQDAKPLITKEAYLDKEYNAIEKEYQMDLFYQGLKDYQIKKETITLEDEAIIQQLGVLYKINVLDMQGIVKQCIYNDRLERSLLIKECREYYDLKMPEKFEEIHHHQSIKHRSTVGTSSMDSHIKYLESISPYKLLKDKQGGKEPVKKDLMVVESVMTTLGLEPGVVNALIEFTLSQCDQTLPRGYMEYYGAKWRRKKITTVKEAIGEARKTLQDTNKEKPAWAIDHDVKEVYSETESNEIDDDALESVLDRYG